MKLDYKLLGFIRENFKELWSIYARYGVINAIGVCPQGINIRYGKLHEGVKFEEVPQKYKNLTIITDIVKD